MYAIDGYKCVTFFITLLFMSDSFAYRTEFPKAIADFKQAIILLQKQVVPSPQTHHKQTNKDTNTHTHNAHKRTQARSNRNSAKRALEALSEGKDENVPAKPAQCGVWEGERGKENAPVHSHQNLSHKLQRSSKRTHTHSLVADVYHNCGYSYYKCNKIDAAIQYLTKSLELHSSNIRVRVCCVDVFVFVCVCVRMCE